MKRKINWKYKIISILTIFISTIIIFEMYVTAATGSNEIFHIIGYDENDIIKDSDGNVISGHAYCLNKKSDTPYSTDDYTRVKLSEIDTLKSNYQNRLDNDNLVTLEQEYTDKVKTRLIKFLVGYTDIIRYVNSTFEPSYNDRNAQEIIDRFNNDESDTEGLKEFEIVRLRSLKYPDQYNYIKENNVQLTEQQYRYNWNKFIYFIPQRIVWAIVHDDSKWSEFVNDDGTVSGHTDSYYLSEQDGYCYHSNDPINDDESMWNVLYKPIIDYIDNNIPDYYAQGYDAWVYLAPEDSYRQNILGTAFRTTDVNISKTDITNGQELSGAVLKLKSDTRGMTIGNVTATRNGTDIELTKNSDNTEITFISGDSETTLSRVPEGEYTLTEESAPNGYLVTSETKFTVNRDGTITQGETTVSNNMIVIEDNITEVQISKKKVSGEDELVGAKFALYKESDFDANGNIKSGVQAIDTWISGDDTDNEGKVIPHSIKGLSTGVNYIIREIEAPEGFKKANDVVFSFEKKDENIVTVNGERLTNNLIIIRNLEVEDPGSEANETQNTTNENTDGLTINSTPKTRR